MSYFNAMQLRNAATPVVAPASTVLPSGTSWRPAFNAGAGANAGASAGASAGTNAGTNAGANAGASNRTSITGDGAFRYTSSQLRNEPASSAAQAWRLRDPPRESLAADGVGEHGTGLPISLVDPQFQCIFPYPGFNAVQSTCFDTAYLSNENLVVAAPTASGKTVVFELALLRFFFPDGTPDGERMMRRRKAVYISPLRALCQERCMDWATKFKEFDIKCGEVTGDTEPSADDISGMDIILTTPEKYNAITIKNYDNFQSVNRVGLILIDEVHVLNEDRGPILEGLVSRFKRLKRKAEELTRLVGADEKGTVSAKHADAPVRSLRLIALSATIPNVEDVAEWLEAKHFSFNENFRPVPLEFNVIPYQYHKTGFLFDNHLNFKLWEIVKKFSSGKPTLVFCATRKGCSSAASQLVKAAAGELIRDKERRQRLKDAAAQISVPGIADLVRQGVGVHTAALSYGDRRQIENAFLAQDLQVLCTTTTLAQGVNLPAHLVIIKSTQHWIKGKGYIDYPKSTMLQMIGRAGRPQYDNVGVAVVMTSPSLVSENRRLLGGTVVESHLMDRMIEHLNAEVVSGSVSDIADAILWFKSTFLHVRLHKNPKAYGYETSGTDLEQIVMKLVTADLEKLRDAKVLINDADGYSFRSTDLGKIMARFNLLFSTVQLMASIPPNADLELLLQLLSKAGEFKDMTPKLGEKKILNVVNKGEKKSKDTAKANKDKDDGRRGVRWVIKEGVKEAHDKVFVLLQAALEGTLEKQSLGLTFNLKMDAKNALQIGQRIARAFAEALLQRSDCFHAARNACLLEKMLSVPCWDSGGPRSLLQVHGIGEKTAADLASYGITSLMDLENKTPHDLDVLTNKRNFGAKIKDALSSIPLYALDVTSRPAGLARTLDLRVIQQRSNFEPPTKWHRALLLAGDPTSGKILLNKSIRVNSGTDDDTVLPHVESWQRVHVHLIDRKYMGVDIMAIIDPSSGPVGRRPATTATTTIGNARPQAAAGRVAPVYSPVLSAMIGTAPSLEVASADKQDKSDRPVAGKKRRPTENPLLSTLEFMQEKMKGAKAGHSTVGPSAKRLKIGGLGDDMASVVSEQIPHYDAIDAAARGQMNGNGHTFAELPLQRAMPAAKPLAAGAVPNAAVPRASPYFAAPVTEPLLPFARAPAPASGGSREQVLQRPPSIVQKQYAPPRDDGNVAEEDAEEWIPQRYAPLRPATNDSRVNVRVRTLSGGLSAGPARDEAKRQAQGYNRVFEGLY